jgi:hypothetical protein
MVLILFALVASPAILGFAAQLWGADSRELNLDERHPSAVVLR